MSADEEDELEENKDSKEEADLRKSEQGWCQRRLQGSFLRQVDLWSQKHWRNWRGMKFR